MNISTNTSSIFDSQSMLNISAKNISSAANKEVDLSKEMTNQIVAQNNTEANVTAIKAADEVMGTLLDIKA